MQELEKKETGVVKWYNQQRGYGFIGRDSGDEDVMVQYDHININGFRALEEGQRVSFVVHEGRMGLTATAVTPLKIDVDAEVEVDAEVAAPTPDEPSAPTPPAPPSTPEN